MYQLKKRIGNIISTLLKFTLFICFAFPFYWMVTTAFKSYQESIAFPPTLWPHNFSWQAFISVCQKIDIIHYFKNLFWFPRQLSYYRPSSIFQLLMALPDMILKVKKQCGLLLWLHL